MCIATNCQVVCVWLTGYNAPVCNNQKSEEEEDVELGTSDADYSYDEENGHLQADTRKYLCQATQNVCSHGGCGDRIT